MAARHRLKQGKEPVAPERGRSLAANTLWMLFRAEPSPSHVRAMDVSLDPLCRARVQRLDIRGPGDRLDALRLALGNHRSDRRPERAAARRGERASASTS